VEKGRQAGPVPEETLLALIREGMVRLDTLVWREGMEQWKALRDLGDAEPPFLGAVQAALAKAVAEDQASSTPPGGLLSGEGQALCAECRRVLSTGDMIPFGEQWVCADCKPLFFQRIREGVQPVPVLRYAGFWIRFAAMLLDFVFILVLWIVISFCLSFAAPFMVRGRQPPYYLAEFLISMFLPLFLFLGIPVLYRTLLVGRFGATLGKMACGLRVVRPDGTKVGTGRAFVRYFAEWISWILFFMGYIIVAFDDQKRALHDHICSTRVVRKV